MPQIIKIQIKSGFQTCRSTLAAALDVQKPEEDQTQGSFFAFGTSLDLNLEAHRDPDVHCSNSYFLKDVCDEMNALGGSWDPETFLKAPTTHALSHRYSNFGYDMENKKL